jgi:hypothetical protein
MEQGKVRVQVQFDGVVGDWDVPVEVRKPSMAFVQRGTGELTLTPGTYYLSTRLPSGNDWVQQVEVTSGGLETVLLKVREKEKSSHEWFEPVHHLRRASQPQQQLPPSALRVDMAPSHARGSCRGTGVEGLGGGNLEARLRRFRGNPLRLTGEAVWQEDNSNIEPQDHANDAAVHFILGGTGDEQPQWLQLSQPGQPPVNVPVVAGPDTPCRVYVARDSDGRASLQVHVFNAQANALLGYRETGDIESTATLAERLLKEKIEDPIAATVGAYALLRFSDLDRLHDWTENLRQMFLWLPDGSAIRGEHLAREGNHTTALDAFLELAERGLPFFGSGLTYAVDRLRTYVSFNSTEEKNNPNEPESVKEVRRYMQQVNGTPPPQEIPFESGKLEAARSLLTALSRFLPFVDHTQSILTWTGLTPFEPDNQVLSAADFTLVEGTDVGTFLALG